MKKRIDRFIYWWEHNANDCQAIVVIPVLVLITPLKFICDLIERTRADQLVEKGETK